MRMLSFIIYLGIAISANAEMCPPSEAILPCYCSDGLDNERTMVLCTNNNNDSSTEDLAKALKKFVGMKNLKIEIEYFDITKMPLTAFEGIGIKSLDVHQCVLPSVNQKDQVILLGLEDSIEELFYRNTITEDNDLSKLRYGHLKKLRLIEFKGNTINELSDGWFKNSNLEQVKLFDNVIEKIGNRAFASMRHLKSLMIRRGVRSVKRSMFPSPADHLKTLEFEWLSLSRLDEDMFSDMPALKSVSLRGNEFRTLDQNLWEPVFEQLQDIELNYNPMQCDSGLKWTFDLRRPIVRGMCTGPESTKRRTLSDFLGQYKEKKEKENQI